MTGVNPFVELKKEMDNLVIGHEDVKTALLLGVIAREHIYVEGPPGTAKTMLAEIIARAAHLKFFFYQLHRDTRLSELLGDLIISKEVAENGGGELIRQSIMKGGILTAQICLLDDISRAPGESLNVLLRILNERKFGDEKIPLLTAIATSNPTADEYYNEPLDPANLDRFVLQIKSHGLSYGKRWEEAKKVLRLYAERPFEFEVPARISREVFDEYYNRLSSVVVPEDVQDGLLGFISTLIEDYGLDETNSLISDRTFFVKSLKILKAHALLNNRDVCTTDDLMALKYMTAFRVPEEIFLQIDKILEEAIDKKKTETEPQNNLDPSSEFEREIPGGSTQLASPEGERRDSQDEMEKARKTFFDALKELKESIASGKDKKSPQEEQRADGIPQADLNDDSQDDGSQKPKSSQMVYGSKSRKAGEDDETWIGSGKKNTEVAENVKIIMKVLEGHIQRNIALDAPHPGGLPRRWKRMNYFDELEDIDPFEAMFWSEYTSPSLPRVHKREKEMLGGEIAILRDVSTSMMGVYSEWSSSVVRGVIEVAKAKRMRVGYIEFNHKSYKYRKNSKFFTRDYPWILDRASRTECSGNTNYEDALKDALNEFKGRGLRNKHILFITDGIPTSGDCEVSNERLRAKKLGVCIHSIFIGSKNYPKILETISRETSGTQFIASRKKDGTIKIEKKVKQLKLAQPRQEKAVDPFVNAFSHRNV
jgi:MoxR-like ATPase